jgi:hypothetical protein
MSDQPDIVLATLRDRCVGIAGSTVCDATP